MDLETAVAKLNGLLDLSRKVVGVKLVQTAEEFEAHMGIALKRPLFYCVAVKSAMGGARIKLSKATSGCSGSSRALGFTEPAAEFWDGRRGREMGLYQSVAIASQVAAAIPITPLGTYGAIIQPAEYFTANPDVILIATFPRQIMRILQGYTFSHGLAKGMHMSGNQAVCVECTVTPVETGHPNVSMLCSGTRHCAQWEDTEAMIGIPFQKFYATVQGIEGTVNAVEPDENKQRIEAKLSLANHLDFEIAYGKTYYTAKK